MNILGKNQLGQIEFQGCLFRRQKQKETTPFIQLLVYSHPMESLQAFSSSLTTSLVSSLTLKLPSEDAVSRVAHAVTPSPMLIVTVSSSSSDKPESDDHYWDCPFRESY